MTVAGEGVIPLRPDFSEFTGRKISKGIDPALDDTEKHGKKRFGAMFGGFAVAAGGAFAAVGVGSFLKGAVDAASDLSETLSKSNTVFGKSGKTIEKWAEGASDDFGQSKQGALEAASTFGNLFVQLGIGADEAAKMSQAQTELASDFASFYNTSPEEAIQAMTAAYRGEYDAVQRYVPTINAASVEQKALEMGLAASTKELTAQDKALAVQTILMEEAGDAVGDFDRTAGGLANQQRKLSAVWEDAKATLGERLLPVVTTVTAFLAENLPRAIDFVSGAFTAVRGVIEPVVDAFGEGGLNGVLNLVGKTISDALPGIKEKLGEWATAAWQWVVDATPVLLEKVWGMAEALGEWLIDTGLPWLVGKLREWAGAFVDWVTPLIPPLLLEMGKLLVRLGDWLLTTALPNIVGKLGEWAKAFAGWVPGALLDLLGKLGTFLIDLGKWVITDGIPKLAELGVDLGKGIIDAIIEQVKKLPGAITDAVGGMGGALAGAGKRVGSWLNPFGDGPGAPAAPGPAGGGGGSAAAMARAAIAAHGGRLTSGYRSPARNAQVGGSPTSYHTDAKNPAQDLVTPNMGATFSWLYSKYGRNIREMIFGSQQVKNGKLMPYLRNDHWDHVHVAHTGGIVDKSWPTFPALRRDERPVIAQVGEAILTERQQAAVMGGGQTVNIYAQSDTAEDIRREFERMVWLQGATA